MCIGGGGAADTGPTAAQLAQQKQQEEDHQAVLASIQADRDQIAAQAKQLTDQQQQFATQQDDYVKKLAIATQTAQYKYAASIPDPQTAVVETGADTAGGSVTDAQADAGPTTRKRGAQALRIDLTAPFSGATGLNIPIG